jgi:6-phosphogluconate dehydrogenase
VEPGDIIIDGGNTNWRDAVQDAQVVKAKGLHYMDAGTSGGVWGLQYGYCLMVGGEDDIYQHCEPLLKALAPPEGGLVHTGPEGSGHFVKMVHNGIEYAMMQAYAEGFNLMKRSVYPNMDLHAIAEAWRYGSVVRSWLLDLVADGLAKDPELDKLRGYVEDTGEGRWTVDTAIDCAVPTPVIALALFERFRSRESNSFADRMLAMLRNQFGGHAVKTS